MPEGSDKQRYREHRWEKQRKAREAIKRASGIMELWTTRLKAREDPFFMPTIRGAILAGYPWLLVDCQSCGLMIDLDLRVKPRPEYATVLMAVRDIKCPRCNGHGRPVVEGLAQAPR